MVQSVKKTSFYLSFPKFSAALGEWMSALRSIRSVILSGAEALRSAVEPRLGSTASPPTFARRGLRSG